MYTFEFGTRFLLNDNEYEIRKVQGQELEVENLSYKQKEKWTVDELLNKWERNELIFKVKENAEKIKNSLEAFSLLPEDKKEEARQRYKQIQPVIDGEILSDQVKDYLEEIGVAKSQFYFWKRKWESMPDIRVLVSNKRGPKKGTRKKVSKEILKLIEEIIEEYCYSGEKHTDVSLYQELMQRLIDENQLRVKEDQIPDISIATFRRNKKGIIDRYRVEKTKLGSVEAKRRKDGTTGEVVVRRPLQRVEIDWTPVHLMLINPETGKAERPNLVYGIDKYTGYPLGFYITFGSINTAALKQCLLHIIMPKKYVKEFYPLVKNDWITYGIPEVIILDNAKVNESLDLEDACLQLNIKIQYAKVAAGNQKGSIERAFRTLNDKYFHSMFGTTFSNTFSNTQEKGLYDSQGRACISIGIFIYMIHLILVDDIAQSHSEKRKGTPAILWKNALESNPHLSFPLTQTVEELKVALMSGIETRKIHESGVMILKEYYNSTGLMELRRQLIAKYNHASNVRVRYDLADMREVYVWDEFNGYYIKAAQTGLERRGIVCPEHILERKLDKFESKNPNPTEELLKKGEVGRKVRGLMKEEEKTHKKSKAGKEGKEVSVQENENDGISIVGIPNVKLLEENGNVALVGSLEGQTDKKTETKFNNKNSNRKNKTKDKPEEKVSQVGEKEDSLEFIDYPVSSIMEGLNYGE